MQSTALEDLKHRDKVFALQKNQFVMCPTHQNYEITNICMNPNCLEPLCPECIRTHQYVHAGKHDNADIDTIQNVRSQCINHIKSIRKEVIKLFQILMKQQFEFEKQELTRFSDRNRGEMIDQCKQKLKKAKEKAIDIVVNYFTTLEKLITIQISYLQSQIGQAIDKHEKEHPGEYISLDQRLETQLKKFDDSIAKLEGPSYVKPTLKVLIQDQNNEYESMRKEIENAIDFYHKVIIDMADVFVDESKLYTLNMELNKYVVFKIGGPPEGSNYQPLKISQLTSVVPKQQQQPQQQPQQQQQIITNKQIFSQDKNQSNQLNQFTKEMDSRFDSKYKDFLYSSPNKISSTAVPLRSELKQDNKQRKDRVVGYGNDGLFKSSRQIDSIFDKYQADVQSKNSKIIELQKNQNLSHFIPGIPQQRQSQTNLSKYEYDSQYNQSSAPKSRFKN